MEYDNTCGLKKEVFLPTLMMHVDIEDMSHLVYIFSLFFTGESG